MPGMFVKLMSISRAGEKKAWWQWGVTLVRIMSLHVTQTRTLPWILSLSAVLRTMAQTSRALSRMRVHIYNLGAGVNRHLFPLNPFNSESLCIFFHRVSVAGFSSTADIDLKLQNLLFFFLFKSALRRFPFWKGCVGLMSRNIKMLMFKGSWECWEKWRRWKESDACHPNPLFRGHARRGRGLEEGGREGCRGVKVWEEWEVGFCW